MDTPSQPSIAQMIHDLEDGILDHDEHQQLMELLRTDPSAREAYIEHMKFVAIMRTEADLVFGGARGNTRQHQRRSTYYSVLAAAAILVLLAAVGYIIQTSNLAKPEKSIRLTGDHDSIWSMTHASDQGHESIQPGTEINVQKGFVALDFSSDVKAVIEGPAVVHIVSHGEIRMVQGRGWFQVAPAGHGFTVNTNHLKVVDLGTEFGVISGEDGHEEVHVALGKVRVSSRRNKTRTVELTTGQAISTWITEQLVDTPCRPEAFLKYLPQGTPYLHWSFDQLTDGTYAANGTMPDAEQYAMKLNSFIPGNSPKIKDTSGRHGRALNLPGGGVYASSEFPGIGKSLPRTIALWVRFPSKQSTPAEKSPYIPGLVGWGNPSIRHEHWRVGINDRFPTKNMVTFWGYEYSNTPIEDAKLITDGEWHHLTFVFSGNYDDAGHPVIRHYFDGKPQSKIVHSTLHTRINTDITSAYAQTLRLGPDARDNSEDNTFSGLIDELYIFRGVLTDAQVLNLMKTNQYVRAPQFQVPATDLSHPSK